MGEISAHAGNQMCIRDSPYIVFSIQMICVAYFSESEKYAELAEINQKMLRQLIAHRDMLTLE